MISFGRKLDELLVRPMPPIVAAPDSSIDEPACNRSARKEDGRQVPCLGPGWLRVKVRQGLLFVASNHGLLFKTKPPSGI
jgi:hypothetical protein